MHNIQSGTQQQFVNYQVGEKVCGMRSIKTLKCCRAQYFNQQQQQPQIILNWNWEASLGNIYLPISRLLIEDNVEHINDMDVRKITWKHSVSWPRNSLTVSKLSFQRPNWKWWVFWNFPQVNLREKSKIPVYECKRDKLTECFDLETTF